MRLSARVDYALRAMAELAAASVPYGDAATSVPVGDAEAAAAAGAGAQPAVRPVTADRLAAVQQIPPKFLESILLQLRRAGVVTAQRGPDGGYRLARLATEITLADVIRAIDGPLANGRGHRPEDLGYTGAAEALQEVWIALRASEREILELVSVADVAAKELPERVRTLVADPRAWV
jgi:Rrf2 family protein